MLWQAKSPSEGFALIRQSDTIPGEESFYQEPHRPQFHFTQKVGWNNDPNGMVYHDGTWHLFFQHNPVGSAVGQHDVGTRHQPGPAALGTTAQQTVPEDDGTSVTVSPAAQRSTSSNTAGWGENTLVAFLTDTGAGESIAYSTDGGETFTWYEGNPVVKHKGRDPKVIWYAYDDSDKPLNRRSAANSAATG